MERDFPSIGFRTPLAGLLSWVVPGLGHIYLGNRARGLVCLIAITATFWTGIAIGGAGTTIDPSERTLWFSAQMCSGANALAGYAMHNAVVSRWTPTDRAEAMANWTSSEVGVHYTGVAGLLNILVVLDALARAEVLEPRALARRREPLRGVT